MIAKAKLAFAVLCTIVSTLSIAGAALGQTALGAAPSISVAEAQRRFEEGVRAYDRKNYEAARVAFAQAYTLEPLPQLLVNLGHMELRTARYVDGARHLSQALRDAEIGADERSKAEEALRAAEEQVGRVQVALNVDGVTLVIDDDKVGTSPMIYAWYVEPGEHRLRASKKGYAPRDEVFGVSKGQTKKIQVSLRLMESAEVEADPPVDSLTISLPPREKVPLFVGAGLTVAGLGTGVAFALLASGDRSDRDDALSSLRSETGISNPCGAGSAFETRCRRIDQSDSSSRNRQLTSKVGFAVGGVAAIATLTYWFWPRSTETEADTTVPKLSLTPVLSPSALILHTSGSF